jgi:hypothetical protein
MRAISLLVFLAVFITSCSPRTSRSSTPMPPAVTLVSTFTSTPNPTETSTFVSTDILAPTKIATETPPPPLEIVIDTNPEKLPSLTWEYATSEQFIKDLIEMDKRGLLPDVPDTAIPLSSENPIVYIPDSTLDSSFIKKYGWGSLFTISKTYPYKTLENRPWVTVGVWSTKFDGAPGFVFVNKWRNPDGTHGFLGYFSPSRRSTNLSDELNNTILYNKDIQSLLTGLYMTGLNGCNNWASYYTIGTSTFCNWYLDHSVMTLAPEVFRNWAKTGILKNTITGKDGQEKFSLPFAPVGFRSIR